MDLDLESIEQVEAAERARASQTPLALVVEVLGCARATRIVDAGHPVPIYQFFAPCIAASPKTQPDQECRHCRYATFHRLGQEDPEGFHRYPEYGMVIPIQPEQIQAVVNLLEQDGATPLRAPRMAVQRHQEAQAREHAEAEARTRADWEERQRGDGRITPVLGG